MVRHDSSSSDDGSVDASGARDAAEKKRLKKERKKEKKLAKKAKKAAKREKKRKRLDSDDEEPARERDVPPPGPEVSADAVLATAPADPAPEPEPAPAAPPKKQSRASFFASLNEAEDSKGMIGTFHATGKFKELEEEEKDRSGDWECQKCGYKNFKEQLTCARCRSLRRFEGRNQASGYCQ
mmetsp:Transcript_14929/g.44572  ORF Transcript_14929/g.44572 Transcript_14929/m.44572 type:complete len:182 (-) Transcript_14929:24-569(-)